MVSWDQFEASASRAVRAGIISTRNPEQKSAIEALQTQSLFIVAGPGSGKTTVIALRVLKLIFVDNCAPTSIVATTFTRKAAQELRSRILGWGDQIRNDLKGDPKNKAIADKLEVLDLNKVTIGTLDSIAQDVLTNVRAAGAAGPVVVEDFAAGALMVKAGLFTKGRYKSKPLKIYLRSLSGMNFLPNMPAMVWSLRTIKDRFYFDQIDRKRYLKKASRGAKLAVAAIGDYEQTLADRLVMDFAQLETEFLRKIKSGDLDTWLKPLKHILVDEYQDTNLLQEQIYMAIAARVKKARGSITVVGDDDQSLYRFRGATVDLFQDFPARLRAQTGMRAQTVFLSRNYRSTGQIVQFCNAFVALDPAYTGARVGGKPAIVASRPGSIEIPVLGMFRDDIDTLATDLATTITKIVNGKGLKVKDIRGTAHQVRVDPRTGTAGDIVFLSSSPQEYRASGKERLPLLLRRELAGKKPAIHIFNPRGRELPEIPDIELLCGLVLECLDPGSTIEGDIKTVPNDVRGVMKTWRRKATDYIAMNPPPHRPTLKVYVDAWAKRRELKSGKPFTQQHRIGLAELMYNLVSWLPNMQQDIEGLVHLEAVVGTVTKSALFAGFEGEVIFDHSDKGLEQSSIKDAYRNTFMPLASGAIPLNEQLLETLPRDRLNLMSIHQSKGLEFPLVIVDVGSDFDQAWPGQAFRRYPANISAPCLLEQEYRPHSPLPAGARSGIDRSFDDLIRQYFVSFSRAQDVLLLVGLNSSRHGYATRAGKPRVIENVATGWIRPPASNWAWGTGLKNLTHI